MEHVANKHPNFSWRTFISTLSGYGSPIPILITMHFWARFRTDATAFQETVTEDYCEKIKTLIFDGLTEMKLKYSGQSTCNFKLGYGTVNSVYWNPTHTLVNLDEM